LRRELTKGLLASVYVPEAWLTLADALQAAGDEAAAGDCLQVARRWIADAVMPDVLPATRAAFEQAHPINRVVLAGLSQPLPLGSGS
jgi:hypothetical protein